MSGCLAGLANPVPPAVEHPLEARLLVGFPALLGSEVVHAVEPQLEGLGVARAESVAPLGEPQHLGVHLALVALAGLVDEGLGLLHGLGDQRLKVVDDDGADVRDLARPEACPRNEGTDRLDADGLAATEDHHRPFVDERVTLKVRHRPVKDEGRFLLGEPADQPPDGCRAAAEDRCHLVGEPVHRRMHVP